MNKLKCFIQAEKRRLNFQSNNNLKTPGQNSACQENWYLYTDFAWQAYQRGNLTVAETLLRLALLHLQELGIKDSRYASTLEHLGDVLLANERHEESSRYFLQCLSLLNILHGKNSTEAATIKIKLADAFLYIGRHSLAEELLSEAQSHFKRLLGSEHEYSLSIQRKLENLKQKQNAYNSSALKFFNTQKTTVSLPKLAAQVAKSPLSQSGQKTGENTIQKLTD
ncbi:MAG: tetratricopeptide repeat protein [Candidatus Obscuribacter sp.]|nr:tetratricopeptide repeat protein [Candidatus Melainabacteria bacterium]MDX1985681.1 tetratricopeptide repeat protein [Candidatus Obscuribacter sp.]